MPAESGEHCSAFAAVGPATKDGKVVFGHVTMFGLHLANHFNVWIDIAPEKGRRLAMQTFPGGIHSGMDYYINDRGIMMAETTFKQTRFDPKGKPLASRVRQAMQYGESIDQVCETLRGDNNGLYANEWILADVNRNEVALFLLGTHQSKLMRSSKYEWFGGTEGFYWSCNTIKDAAIRLETIPGVNGRPQNLAWKPSDRDVKWQALYQQNKGKIDADFGKLAFNGPGLAKSTALDAKVTTTAMAQKLQTWAIFGPPRGWLREPTPEERAKFPDIRALTPNTWTMLHVEPPQGKAPAIVRDIPERKDAGGADIDPATIAPAWHGTILAKEPSDLWLSTAFADYERIAALEIHMREKGLKPADLDRLAVMLAAYRKTYLNAIANGASPIQQTLTVDSSDQWYHVANGKGVLTLHALRQDVGLSKFAEVMDSFGRKHAGQSVTRKDFVEHCRSAFKGQTVDSIVDSTVFAMVPSCELQRRTVQTTEASNGYQTTGIIRRTQVAPKKLPTPVELTIVTSAGEEQHRVVLDNDETQFTVISKARPVRLILDKYGDLCGSNPHGVRPMVDHLESTTIVYATGSDEPANRIAATEVQRIFRTRGANIFLPMVADVDAKPEALKSQHLILVGMPKDFRWSGKPLMTPFVSFGGQSFTVRGDCFAHAGSAVITVAQHPFEPKKSAILLSGNGGEATVRAVPALLTAVPGADVLVLPNRGKEHASVGVAESQVVHFDR